MTKPLRLTWTTSVVDRALCAVQMKEEKDGHLKYERREHPPTEGRQKFNQNLNHISKRWDLPLTRDGPLSRENKLIALEPFTTLCENHTLHSVGKVARLRRKPII